MLAGKGYFITGTDTDIGKTWSTLALMRAIQNRGRTVVGMKPVAAGCTLIDGEWRNQDALLLQQSSSLALDYPSINPYAFPLAASPHVACGERQVDLGRIGEACAALKAQVDVVLVEGAGGWLSPLDRHLSNADLAVALGLPVIMVVGMRLGCLNHALLTIRVAQASGVRCVGWLAAPLQPQMTVFAENVQFLRKALGAPLLGVLPFVDRLDVDCLARAVEWEILDEVDLSQS